MAAMLVELEQKNIINLFCLWPQHGCQTFVFCSESQGISCKSSIVKNFILFFFKFSDFPNNNLFQFLSLQILNYYNFLYAGVYCSAETFILCSNRVPITMATRAVFSIS